MKEERRDQHRGDKDEERGQGINTYTQVSYYFVYLLV